MTHLEQPRALQWQSRTILAGTLFLAVAFELFTLLWTAGSGRILFGLVACGVLALAAGFLRSVTPFAAVTGGILSFSLFLSCVFNGAQWWRSALLPLLTLFVLTHFATRFGRDQKQIQGTAESRRGRKASQVAANIGVASTVGPLLIAPNWILTTPPWRGLVYAILPALVAALAEAAADTVSSEIGQAIGGEPRLLTTWRRVPAGTDGAVSAAGSVAGLLAAAAVVAVSMAALRLSPRSAAFSLGGAVFGFFFDSFLGATLERRGWLNNDAVNFLSTLAAALVAGLFASLWAVRHL
jgi:uncharacterized protein (TIGR00297 family)